MKLNNLLNEKKMIIYHGTDANIEQFDVGKRNKEGHDQYGPGVYFSNSIDVAHQYGKNVYQANIDDSNFITSSKTIRPHVITYMLKKSPHLEDVLTNWDENPYRAYSLLYQSMIDNSNNMIEALLNVWSDGYQLDNLSFIKNITKYYNGLKLPQRNGVIFYTVWRTDVLTNVKKL